jgi:hypothetical protein
MSARISRCAEHGLHGARPECFVCGEPVERVLMLAVDDVLKPGPVRSAVIAAAASTLRMDLGLCGDRARVVAERAVDRALAIAVVHVNGIGNEEAA